MCRETLKVKFLQVFVSHAERLRRNGKPLPSKWGRIIIFKSTFEMPSALLELFGHPSVHLTPGALSIIFPTSVMTQNFLFIFFPNNISFNATHIPLLWLWTASRKQKWGLIIFKEKGKKTNFLYFEYKPFCS